MKFGRLLQDFNTDSRGIKRARNDEDGDSCPSSSFLDYKRMKKILKKANVAKEDGDHELMRQLEKEFVDQLHEDLEEINSSFIEQEEEAVIKMQTLRDEYEAERKRRSADPDSVEEATWLSSPTVRSIRSRFADLHGELVLLLHWSIMNYAGTLKILKKHDKLLGGHSQQNLLGTILNMPFTSTASIAGLASSAEMYVKELGGQKEVALAAPALATAERTNSLRELMDEAENWAKDQDSGNAALIEKTRAALAMLTELKTSAHSPSTFNHEEISKAAAHTSISA